MWRWCCSAEFQKTSVLISATVGRQRRKIETEAAAHLVRRWAGADTELRAGDSMVNCLMVLCCDPLAIALTAAASARR
jgi:hypothetical protein